AMASLSGVEAAISVPRRHRERDRGVALVVAAPGLSHLAGMVGYALTVDYQPQGRYHPCPTGWGRPAGCGPGAAQRAGHGRRALAGDCSRVGHDDRCLPRPVSRAPGRLEPGLLGQGSAQLRPRELIERGVYGSRTAVLAGIDAHFRTRVQVHDAIRPATSIEEP